MAEQCLPLWASKPEQAAHSLGGAPKSHPWEPSPALLGDSVRAPLALSVPPVGSTRPLALLSTWHRGSVYLGLSSKRNGAEVDTMERQLPAPGFGAEAWTLSSNRENGVFNPAAHSTFLQIEDQGSRGNFQNQDPRRPDQTPHGSLLPAEQTSRQISFVPK